MPRNVQPPQPISSSLPGDTIGERIWAAMERCGRTNQSELARRCGVSAQAVAAWLNDRSVPSADNLRAISAETGVTIDEIVGVAAGQDPSFLAWREFLATDDGKSMDAGERRALQAIAWPPGREPTVPSYVVLLAGLRAGKARQ